MLQDHFVNESSKLNKTSKTNDRKRKQPTAKFILRSIDSTKVSKMFSKRRSLPQKMSVTCDVLQTMKTTTVDHNAPRLKNKQAFKIKNATPVFFHFIHSSKVFKPGTKQSIRLYKNHKNLASITGPYQLVKGNLRMLFISSTDKKAMQLFTKTSLWKNTRKSKQSERFYFDYT